MNLKLEIENWIKQQIKPFISERHLQDELWYYMRSELKIENVVVEFPFKQKVTRGHSFLDIYAEVDGVRYGIEIKYQTKKEVVNWYGKEITLKDKGADDVMRISCVLDVQRLEWLKEHDEIDEGIFILMSNSKSVWAGTKASVVDNEFRFYDDNQKLRTLTGALNVDERSWTKEYQNININGDYVFEINSEHKNVFYSILET